MSPHYIFNVSVHNMLLVFRYLEYAVKEDDGCVNNKAEAVHNLLVFLYIQHDRY